MKRHFAKSFKFLLAGSILATGFLVLFQNGAVSAKGPGGNGMGSGLAGNGTGSSTSGMGTSLTPLTESESDALIQAILEEYGAINLYKAVINDLGSVVPFSQIVISEQQHVNALVKQATKYGIAVPPDPGMVSDLSFDSLFEACTSGTEAELKDAALYDELKLTTTRTDLLRVYNSLQSASLMSHLPQFQNCD